MNRRDLENFDFIKSRFDEAVPAVPFGLNEQVIERKIISKEKHKVIKIKPKKNYKAIVSAAACFLLIFGLLFAVYPRGLDPNVIDTPVQVATFNNYDELNAMIENLNNRADQAQGILDNSGLEGPQRGGGDDTAYSNENAAGVTDADAIVTDGKYIYYAFENSSYSSNFSALKIYRVNGEETELIAQLETDAKKDKSYIKDMFLYKNRLIVNIANYSKSNYESHAGDVALTRIYDVSNPEKPALISEFSQTGEYVSSKMINNIVYVVSSYSVPEHSQEYNVPVIGKGNEKAAVAANNIACFDDACNSQYAVISSINVETGERAGEAKAVLGASKYVYCTKDSLYLLKYSVEFGQDYIAEISELNTDELSIIRADINNGEIGFAASGKVNGYINDLYAMNEDNGYFSIITTKLDKQDKPVANNLYVLDKDLKVVGKTEDFAAGKRIDTALFADDKVYVSIFDSENPMLCIIDLGNKELPSVKSSVDIGGVYMQLVPVNQNQILGIGRLVEPAGESGYYAYGLKLALLDVSSAEHPKLLDSVETDAYSPSDWHAEWFSDSERNSYAIASAFYSGEGSYINSGILTINIHNNRIEIEDEFVNESTLEYAASGRSINIGDYIYSFEIYEGEEIEFLINPHKYK